MLELRIILERALVIPRRKPWRLVS